MIYLDNAASTPIHEEVLDAMLPFLKEQYGNPSSIHRYGRFAHKAIEKSRKQVAELINADQTEVFFTSGGTESNNTAINGIMRKHPKCQLITSSIEHDAILEPCKKLEKEGFDVLYLPVDGTGLIDPDNLKKSITEKTKLISIIFGNNEVGTIEPISELAKIANEKKIPFHTDAIQAVGKVPIDVKELGVDLLSISSHKIYGPKGVGALFVRNGVPFDPLIFGGGQENNVRSGTENVPSVVGFGRACELAKSNLDKDIEYLTKLRDYFIQKIISEIPSVTLNGHTESRLPNNIHLTFLGIHGEDLIIKLDENNIAASTGSACSVRTQKASHVLQAMRFSHEQITGSLRLTLGIFNTKGEIDKAIVVLKKVVNELRAVSPYKDKYKFKIQT